MVSGDALRRAISSQKAEIAARIRKAQGGVPTYFDAFLCNFLDQLASTDPEELSANARTRYLAELQWFENYLENSKAGRLVSYARRRQQDDSGGQSGIRSPERMMSQGTAECLKWKGQALFKTVFDFAIFPMLIWELRPGAVFEIGSGTGASACWIRDMLNTAGLDSQVYSVDVQPIAEQCAGVTFVVGDCASPASLFSPGLLRSAPRPLLVIEDAHVNVRNVLLYLDGFLEKGDYLFVEDSVNKGDDLDAFLTERPGRYAIDTRYTDFFGRNATSAINSIFVRI